MVSTMVFRNRNHFFTYLFEVLCKWIIFRWVCCDSVSRSNVVDEQRSTKLMDVRTIFYNQSATRSVYLSISFSPYVIHRHSVETYIWRAADTISVNRKRCRDSIFAVLKSCQILFRVIEKASAIQRDVIESNSKRKSSKSRTSVCCFDEAVFMFENVLEQKMSATIQPLRIWVVFERVKSFSKTTHPHFRTFAVLLIEQLVTSSTIKSRLFTVFF